MPHVQIFVLTTSEGLIPEVDVIATEKDFVKAVRGWLEGKELYIENDEDRTDAVDDEDRVVPALIESYVDVPTFAWDQHKYEMRWYRSRIEIDPVTLQNFVHNVVEDYDPDEHGYICPNESSGCPCGVVKLPPSTAPTYYVPTHDEFASLVQKALEEQTDATDVTVDVSQWAGYGDLYRGDEDTWVHPVYVTAEDDDEEEEFHDAVIDLGDPTISVQGKVDAVVDDLING